MTTIDIHKPFDRFEFEQQIMECWNVTTDIRVVSEYLMDAPLEDNRQDKIANMLIGIEALYEAKFNKLFRQFEQLIREHAKSFDQMSDEELKDMIEKDLTDRAKKHEKENPIPHDAGWWADDKDD